MKTIEELLKEYATVSPIDPESQRSLDLFVKLPESTQAMFRISPQELVAFAGNPTKELPPEDVPEDSLVKQIGAILSRFKLKQVLVAIAINCQRETTHNQPWSERWGTYGMMIRFIIDYINRSIAD